MSAMNRRGGQHISPGMIRRMGWEGKHVGPGMIIVGEGQAECLPGDD